MIIRLHFRRLCFLISSFLLLLHLSILSCLLLSSKFVIVSSFLFFHLLLFCGLLGNGILSYLVKLVLFFRCFFCKSFYFCVALLCYFFDGFGSVLFNVFDSFISFLLSCFSVSFSSFYCLF